MRSPVDDPTRERVLVPMLLQPWHTLREYDLGKLRADALAGLSVAVVAVPQALAYALVAGVAPQYGLYSLIVQSALGSLLSSEPRLSIGPTNTQALLVAAIATRVAAGLPGVEEPSEALYLGLVIALTAIKGGLQLALASVRLGNLARYVSQSVIVGFTAGAGVLIAAGQLPAFLGAEAALDVGDWPGLLGAGQRLGRVLPTVHAEAVAVGLASLSILVGLGRWAPRLPAALIAIAFASGLAAAAGWSTAVVPRVGIVPASLPRFALPAIDFRTAEALFGGGLALGLMGLIEAFAIGKTIAARSGTRVSANQELMSQGLTNLVSSLFACMPGSASFSRSALNVQAGARTLYAGVLCAGFVAAILLLSGGAMGVVPLASLAAVLFVIAWDLIDWRSLRRLARAHPSDFQVGLGTFAATLLIPLQYAVFVGIVLNLALYLQRTSRLHLAELVDRGEGRFEERPLRDPAAGPSIRFVQLAGDLFFALADELEDRLRELSMSASRVVVIRLKRTTSMDATVLAVLERFVQTMHARQRHVVLCGVAPELSVQLHDYGLVRTIGEANYFESGPGVFASAKRALARARELTG